MSEKTIDERFYKEALDGLKSFRNLDFTINFLKKIKLPVKKNLTQMWADIEGWLSKGDDSDCINLLEYVDDLKMWGRQRIYLFNIEGADTTLPFSDLMRIAHRVKKVFNNPVYVWQVYKPTLVHVKKAKDPSNKDSILVFKFVEMRKFALQVDNAFQAFEERSTNFFIINLSKGYAELRLQDLPVNAQFNLKAEYNRFITEIRKYIDEFFDRFKPIALDRVMHTMIREPIYRITRTTFVTGRKKSIETSTFLLIVNRLFVNPRVSYIAGYWECDQEILGKSRLHFNLFGTSHSIEIGGLANPKRIRDLIQRIVNIYHGIDVIKPPRPISIVDRLIPRLEGNSRAQAFVLAAGAVAGLIIWIILDGFGNYLFESWMEKILGGMPLFIPKILIEIIWILIYYGWKRTIRSFTALKYLSPKHICEIIKDAKKNKKLIKQAIISHYKPD